MDGHNQRETFQSTSGRVFGVFGALLGVGVVVAGLVGGVSWGTVACGVLLGVLSWVVLLRPAVVLDDDELVLRGMLDVVTIPLAAVQELVVRQVLVVIAGDRRFTSAAVGRGRRELFREHAPRRGAETMGGGVGGDGLSGAGSGAAESSSYAELVQSRLRLANTDAMDRAGVRPGSSAQADLGAGVHRRWALPESAAMAASVAAVVVTAVV